MHVHMIKVFVAGHSRNTLSVCTSNELSLANDY